MQNIEKEIEELFRTNGGKILLKTKESAKVLEYSKYWMDARVAQGNGVIYVELNTQKKYRIDHIICFRLQISELKKFEIKQMLSMLLIDRYGSTLSTKQVANVFGMCRTTFDQHKGKGFLLQGIQYVDGGHYSFKVEDVVNSILQLDYVKTSAFN